MRSLSPTSRKALVLALSVAVVGTALLAGSAAARGPRGGGGGFGGPGDSPPGKKGMFGPRVLQQLGLSQDQIETVKTLEQQMKAHNEPLRTEIEQYHTELEALWDADVLDRDAILTKHAEIGAVKSQLAASRVDFRIAVLSMLTPAQRAQMKQLKAQMRQQRRGHFGQGFDAQRGPRGKRGFRGGAPQGD